MKRILAVLPLAAALAQAQPAHYYVDANRGSDNNPGTMAQPFLSIGKAAATATQDVVVHVLPGVYSAATTAEVLPIRIGTSSVQYKNFRLLGLDARACIVDMGTPPANTTTTGTGVAIEINGAVDAELAGLTIRNGPRSVGGAMGWGGWWNECVKTNDVTNANIHHCIFEMVNRGLTNWGKNTDGVWIHDNVFLSTWNDSINTNVDGQTKNIYIYNNVIIGAGANGQGQGMWLTEMVSGQYVYNNIVLNANQNGINWGPVQNTTPPPVMAGNCAFGNGGAPYAYGTLPVPASNLAVDPMLADIVNRDWRLMPGSPCIEAGAYVGLPAMRNDFYGNARVCDADDDQKAVPDIGVHEVNELALAASNFGQGLSATFALSRIQGALPLGGFFFLGYRPISLFMSPFGSFTVDPLSFLLTASAQVPGQVVLAIPVDPILTGLPVYAQALGFRPGIPAGIVFKGSGGLELFL